MELSKERKKNEINSLLYTIARISDKKYQERTWIQAIGPEVSSFDEVYISVAAGDFILKHAKAFGLTASQQKVLTNFAKNFLEFGEDNDWPPFFIDTPEWTRITEMAKEVLVAFNYTYPEA